MNRRIIMTGIATLMAIPTTAKASAILGQSQEATTSAAVKAYAEDLKLWRQASIQVIKTLVEILDDPGESDNIKLQAVDVILGYNCGILLESDTWGKMLKVKGKNDY